MVSLDKATISAHIKGRTHTAIGLATKSDIHTLRFSGYPTAQELISHIEELNRLGVTRRMWVFEKGLNLSAQEMTELLNFRDSISSPDTRVAMVSDVDSGFGQSRMYASHVEHHTNAYRAFRDEQSAISWLTEDE